MKTEVLLGLALGLPLMAAPGLALLERWLGRRVGWIASILPVISTLCLLSMLARTELPAGTVVTWPWVPSLGVSLSFLVDGLSLFFGLVVCGVGILIFWYANFYLDDHCEHPGRFYAYLTLFMGAMLGTVLANNLVLLFVFWELTGLASFLLIGFLHEEERARVGARQALLVTGVTGLCLLAGVVMLGQATGTFQWDRLRAEGLPWARHGEWLQVSLLLLVLGALGKSAQIPFHFWLPNAMVAPTPVSAYLHSATMVKLGVFLCARLFPLFAGQELWAPLLSWVGFGTMLFGAIAAFRSHDLKAILAWSTVSQLGYLIGYYGLGPAGGVAHDYLHILNHVFYKGSLFMVAGVILHSTGVQDIRQLGGLWRRLPVVGVACAVAAATMAGCMGTTGFLSKEVMLQEVLEARATHAPLGGYALTCVVATSLIKIAFALRIFVEVFLGPEPAGLAARFHRPPLAMQIPPLLLAAAALGLGLAPGGVVALRERFAVPGLHTAGPPLALWHGVTPEWLLSLALMAAGVVVYVWARRRGWPWEGLPRAMRLDDSFERFLTLFGRVTKTVTRALQADRPTRYLPIVLGLVVGLQWTWLGWVWITGRANLPAQLVAGMEDSGGWLRSFAAGLIGLSAVLVLVLKRWTTQVVCLSVAGFLITFYFVLYRAPDLALTQILVEAVTLILVLVLLGRFPRSAEQGEWIHRGGLGQRVFHGALSLGVGAMMTVLAVWVSNRPRPRLGEWYGDHTAELAQGNNAVNTILVDFRGFDTLGEITVLVIAALGALGLLMRYKRTPEEYRQGPLGAPGMGVHHPEAQR
ncbi:MAG: hydrogen gas-evolving membrane-bound hydrogenase subunit E [Limisphaera sp.]